MQCLVTPTRRSRRRGVSLVETVIGIVILGGAFVSVLTSVASSRAVHYTTAERALGDALAQDLLAEIMAQDYLESGTTVLGLDADEALGPGRSRYDDVDDYHGWSATPPQNQDGSNIAGADNYTRSVAVAWARLSDPATASAGDDGVKRVTVTVTRGGRTVAELTAYRTNVWQPPQE